MPWKQPDKTLFNAFIDNRRTEKLKNALEIKIEDEGSTPVKLPFFLRQVTRQISNSEGKTVLMQILQAALLEAVDSIPLFFR